MRSPTRRPCGSPTTVDLTDHRLRTLQADPVYRLAVAWQNTGYNQPPHTSFFLGDGMALPPAPSIAVTAAPGGIVDDTAPVVAGVPADGTLLARQGPVTLNLTAADPESGVRNLDVAFDGEPVAPGHAIPLADLVGTHTLTVRAANHAGHRDSIRQAARLHGREAAQGDRAAGRSRPTAAGRTGCTTARTRCR